MLSPLTIEAIQKLTVDDLAVIILKEFQRQDKMTAQEQSAWLSYGLLRFSSIRVWLWGEHREQSAGLQPYQVNQIRQDFEAKLEEAKHRLRSKGLVIQNPQQSHSDDFILLTQDGRNSSANGVILTVTSTEEFLKVVLPSSGFDPVVRAYLSESYGAARHDLWFASASMLGNASERLVNVLAEHVGLLTGDTTRQAALAKLQQVRKIKEWIVDQFPDLGRRYPSSKDAFKDMEDALTTLYTLHRYDRNDNGHPADELPPVEPAKTRAMLEGFGVLARRVHRILAIKPLP